MCIYNISYIPKKNLVTGRPVAKTLIKYIAIIGGKLRRNVGTIDIELNELKADPEMMKMLLTLDDQV